MNKRLERVSSGIPGLDKMIEGGFLKGHSILVCGSYGTGKSTMGLQFLVDGAKKGESGLFITFESEPEQVQEAGESYGWDIGGLVEGKKLKIIRVAPIELLNLVRAGYGQVGDIVKSMGIQRLVVDSISSLEMLGKDDYERRKNILEFVGWLKKHGCTAMLTMDCEPGADFGSKFGIAESLVDSIIVLYHPKEKKRRTRALEILKMRETKHTDRLLGFKITDRGIRIGK